MKWVLAVVVMVGCRSYQDDVETICEAEIAEADKPVFDDATPTKKTTMLLAGLEKKVKTDPGKKLLAELNTALPGARIQTLRTESARAGLQTCALLDFLTRAPKVASTEPSASASASASASVDPPKGISVLELGETKVTGNLAVEQIKSVVRANFAKFRACYEKGLDRDDSMKGTVVVKLAITAAGKMESVTSGGTLTDAPVRTCVVAVYESLTFPLPEKGTAHVLSTIDFRPLR